MTEPSRRWLWAVGVAVTAAGAAVGATFLTLHFSEKPMAAPPAPVTVTSITPVPPAQQSPTDKAAADVKVSMQHKLDTDPDFAKASLTVVDVTLVQKSGNEYKGIATVRTPDGVDHEVPIDVISDDANTLWETPPGAFLFAAPFNRDTPTTAMPARSLPGADETGFFEGPRCMEGNRATLLIRTALSEVVICRRDGPAEVYTYNGMRLSDGARITLIAQPTAADGFVATNPDDGTQYVVTHQQLRITDGNGESSTEPVTAYGP